MAAAQGWGIVPTLYRRIMRTCRAVDGEPALRSLVATASHALAASVPEEVVTPGRQKVAQIIRQANGGADWYIPGHEGVTRELTPVVREAFRREAPHSSSLGVGMAGMKYCSQLTEASRHRLAAPAPAAAEWSAGLASRQITDYRSIFANVPHPLKTPEECYPRTKLSDASRALLLVAHPLMHGGFAETVIVMWIHDHTGTAGVILNVPLKDTPGRRYGGPVPTEGDIMVHSASGDEANFGGGIGNFPSPRPGESGRFPEGCVPVDGLAAWEPQQLMGELESGMWLVAESMGDFSSILDCGSVHSTEDIYKQVLLRMESPNDEVARLAQITRDDETIIGCLDMEFANDIPVGGEPP